MSKMCKILIVFMILISLLVCITYAETTNLYNDVENENTSTNESSLDDDLDLEDNSNTTTQTTGTSTTTSNARVNTISSIPEANLGLNNVLCIILIAIGILIVLLAVAILIRLKK